MCGGGGEGREGGGGRIFSVYWDGGVLEFSFLLKKCLRF